MILIILPENRPSFRPDSRKNTPLDLLLFRLIKLALQTFHVGKASDFQEDIE